MPVFQEQQLFKQDISCNSVPWCLGLSVSRRSSLHVYGLACQWYAGLIGCEDDCI